MNVEEAIVEGKKYIHKNEVLFLLASILNINPLEVYLKLDYQLKNEENKRFLEMLEAKKNGYPLQYIIGSVIFLGNQFLVRENVLIPRFETEEVVSEGFKYINNSHKTLIDLGCGAGVMGISFKMKYPFLDVYLVDLNKYATLLSKDNADILGVDVNIKNIDMFDALDNEYDIYVSNPPYLNQGEAEDVVVKYEPWSALFAEDNGLYYYKKILDSIKFKDNTLVIFEIGDGQSEEIKKYALNLFSDIEVIIKKDMQDRERILIIKRSFDA